MASLRRYRSMTKMKKAQRGRKKVKEPTNAQKHERKPSLTRSRSATVRSSQQDSEALAAALQERLPPRDHRAALERLYKRAAPGKLGHIDAILTRFSNDPEKMYDTLSKLFPNEVIERPAS